MNSVDRVHTALKLGQPDRVPVILTSSNSIHSSCNLQNFVTMVQACHEFGRYPSRG